MKKFKVKTEYLKYYCALVGEVYNSAEHRVMFAEFTESGEHYRILKDAGVLELWCEEIKKEWKEPGFILNRESFQNPEIADSFIDKPVLLIRMQSWADYHNKLDGFVARWDTLDRNYGIVIENYSIRFSFNHISNVFLFQIAVGSKDRAEEMLSYFYKDIQSLIDKNLI